MSDEELLQDSSEEIKIIENEREENSSKSNFEFPIDFKFDGDKKQIEQFSKWVNEADRICFFLGAGMSVASKIPTFRGKFGLWTFGKDLCCRFFVILLIVFFLNFTIILLPITLPATIILFCLTICSPCLPLIGLVCVGTPFGWKYVHDLTWIVFKYFFYDTIEKAGPNYGHKVIRELELKFPNKKFFVVTQNVDALEEKAGFEGGIYQLHGNYYNFFCTKCDETYEKKFHGSLLPKSSPKCDRCSKKKLRTGCLLFNDPNNPFSFPFQSAMRRLNNMEEKDLLIIIGTSGTVYPACQYPQVVPGNIVEINIVDESTFTFTENIEERFLYVKGEQDKILLALYEKLFLSKNEK